MSKSIAGDISRGAREIAKFLYGKTDKRACRAVYVLRMNGELPFFTEGGKLCLRHSTYEQHVAEKEAAGLKHQEEAGSR